MQAQRRRQHQVRAVRLQQIGRADIGPEPRRNQRHHVHQRLGRLAALLGQIGDLLQSQNMIGVSGFADRGHHYRLSISSG